MMIRDCNYLIKLPHTHMEKNVFKVCESEMMALKKYIKDE